MTLYFYVLCDCHETRATFKQQCSVMHVIHTLYAGVLHWVVSNCVLLFATHTHTYGYTCIHIHMYVHTHTYAYACIHIHMHTHAYTYICIRMHTHTYAYACIHIHMDTYFDFHLPVCLAMHVHFHCTNCSSLSCLL